MKRAEAEQHARLWFLESMDRIHRAMQATYDVEVILREVLGVALEIFACDRVWLCYPCDADAPAWRVLMEQSRPEWPTGLVRGRDVPMTTHAAETVRAALAA